jgi:Peptidase A4 family
MPEPATPRYGNILEMGARRLRRFVCRKGLLRFAILMLVTCAFASGVVSTASASSQYSSTSLLTFPAPQSGQGGYSWLGKVKQIGADWKVPAIFKNSRAGDAATWIGAQDDNGTDFIQLGTLENKDLTGSTYYQAFWSDTAVNFSPQILGTVKAGDTVSVRMVRKGYGWSLRLKDRSSALYINRQIDFGFGDPFNQGEWIQENPSSSYNGLPVLPYPEMANVTFRDLMVNKVAPRLGLGDGQVLITSNVRYRVPSAVHSDAFSMDFPSATQLRFLNDMRPSDLEATVFGNEFAHWSSTPATMRKSDVANYVRILRSTTRSLAQQSWPVPTSRLVTKYVTWCEGELRLLKLWSEVSAPLKGSAFENWSVSELQREYSANGLRESLNLPPAY